MTSESPGDDLRTDAPSDSGRVLVVDDESDVAETTALMLERRGLDTLWVSSPEEGLDRLRERRDEIGCVVSDYQMPRMDGLDLLEAMRETDPYLPFVLFTGRGSEQVASEAVDAGVSAYIQKGGVEQYDRLANRSKQALEQERTRRELEATKARFDALARNTAFAIITIDGDSRIHYANEGVEELFGYDPDELVGESLTAIIPDRLADSHRAGIERYLRTGEKRLDWDWIELPVVTRDGEEVPVAVSFGEREGGSQHLFTGLMRDASGERPREGALE